MEVKTFTQISLTMEEVSRCIFYDDASDSYKIDNLNVGRVYGMALKTEFGSNRIARGTLVDVQTKKQSNSETVTITLRLN